ncbi:MAG: type III ribulose-bisphosphate carboxylase, partial [Candidatus Micrarchaeota archaeon]|nr:type III ribulose-bisphosphate carboxylase [Candidatus Micrarchaeota archaeon]
MPAPTAYHGYIDLKYEPTSNDLVTEFRVEPAKGVSFKTAAEAVAGESSIGTWTAIVGAPERIAKTLAPHIFYLNEKSRIAKIAYPSDLFEPGNIPQILSSVAGNVFGMKIVENLRLEDIDFPDSIINSFKGPALGIPGIRKLLSVKNQSLLGTKRPLIGTIVKPKLGLNEKEHANVAYEAWVNGLDLVKDDENLTSMKFNNFEKRVVLTLDAMDRAAAETGEKKLAVLNVTAEAGEMVRRAQFIKDHGGNTAMIDILTAGWAGLQTLRKANTGLIIHAHRAMHAAFTRNPRHGISMLAIAKCARLIGVDTLHIGAVYGKMEGGKSQALHLQQEIEERLVPEHKKCRVLAENWHKIKPVFAVASGGLHPGVLPKLVHTMGNDIIAQMGGGCHGHPRGTAAGARAIRQALDATLQQIPLKEYAKSHEELAQAIKKWG